MGVGAISANREASMPLDGTSTGVQGQVQAYPHTKTDWICCASSSGCHDLWVTLIGSDSQNQPQSGNSGWLDGAVASDVKFPIADHMLTSRSHTLSRDLGGGSRGNGKCCIETGFGGYDWWHGTTRQSPKLGSS
jgi:hypothetical protein